MRAAAAALAVFALAGCESLNVPWYTAPAAESFPTPANATAECADAAKRANKWCVKSGKTVWSDTTWQRECSRAEWDYNDHCPRR